MCPTFLRAASHRGDHFLLGAKHTAHSPDDGTSLGTGSTVQEACWRMEAESEHEATLQRVLDAVTKSLDSILWGTGKLALRKSMTMEK